MVAKSSWSISSRPMRCKPITGVLLATAGSFTIQFLLLALQADKQLLGHHISLTAQ